MLQRGQVAKVHGQIHGSSQSRVGVGRTDKSVFARPKQSVSIRNACKHGSWYAGSVVPLACHIVGPTME